MKFLKTKNLLAVGLLAVSTSANSQSESFIIECKVSGEEAQLLGGRLYKEKITNQTIMVKVDFRLSEMSIDIEGRGVLNIGNVSNNSYRISNEKIYVTEQFESTEGASRKSVDINRVTGFIRLTSTFVQNNPINTSRTEAEGFCQKVSNKQKF